MFIEFFPGDRTRADKRHLSQRDMKKLRQFINGVLAAERRKSMVYPRVRSHRLVSGDPAICDTFDQLPGTALRAGIRPHGPELPHPERNTGKSNALVRNER